MRAASALRKLALAAGGATALGAGAVAAVAFGPSRRVEADLSIDTQPGRVWWTLTDFGSYAEWNPLITEAAGPARAGEHIHMRLAPAGTPALILRPEITVCRPSSRLEVVGRHPIPGVLEVTFAVAVESTGSPDQVHCRAELVLKGMRVLTLPRQYVARAQEALVAMLATLKSRAETQAAEKVARLSADR